MKTTFKTLFLLIFLFQYEIMFSQDFKEYYPDPLTPGGAVAWADYDKDGDPDLVTSGVIGDKSTILYRNDNGQFVETSESFNGIYGSPKWLDWENDGDLDLFLIGEKSRIFRNVNGSFTMNYFLDASFFVWADYELDGDEDLFVRNEGGIGVMRNIGGTFQFKQLISPFPYVKYFTVADFNLDGSVDIFVKTEFFGSDQGEVRLYIYNPKSDYYELNKSNSFVYIPSSFPRSFDADNDGDMDIYYGGYLNRTDTKSTWYLYTNTAGNFSLSTDPFFVTQYTGIRDLDGDGDNDAIKFENGATVYYRNTDGKYSKITGNILNEFADLINISYYGATPEGFQYACISGQVTFNGTYATRIYQLQNGVYKNVYPNPFDQVYTSYYKHTQWIDYNKDGLMDAYISGSGEGSYRAKPKLYQNTGLGFTTVYTFGDNTPSRGDWVDFNKDGNIDFITREQRDVVLYEGFQDDPSNVTRKVILSGPEEFVKPQVIDFDNDNDNDVFVGGYMGGMYTNSNNVLTKTIDFISGYRVLGEADWADYDLDGDKDMVMFVDAGWTYLQKVCVFRNTGTTLSLLTETPFTSLNKAYCKWIDYNKDQYPDLFVFGESLNNKKYVYLYKNSAGVFTAQPTTAFTGLADIDIYDMQINVVDFDMNDFPDLVISGNGSNAPIFQVYRNINGIFQSYLGHGIPVFSDSKLDFSDFDGDGDPDVLYTGRKATDPKTQIYVNQVVNLNQGPLVTSTMPANNQKLTYNNGFTLETQFDKSILKKNGSFKFYRKGDNKLLHEVPISAPAVSVNGTIATVAINVDPFDNGEKIYVLLDGNAFTDNALNTGKGIVSPVSWNLTIQNDKLDQTISFPSIQSVTVGDPDFSLTANASSGLSVSYVSSDISVATVNGNRVTINGVGFTTITATQAGNISYNSATPVTQLLTVSKAKQAISFNTISSKTMGDSPFSLAATASSGLIVLFSATSNRVSLIGDKVTIQQPGPVTINAQQQGDSQFEAALPISQTFCINPSQPKILFTTAAGITTLTSNSEIGNQWYKDRELINKETGRILEVTSSGSYTLTVTIEGCSSERSAAENVLITSLNKEGDKEFRLFPNPTAQKLVVNAHPIWNESEIEAEIIDVTGRSVFQFRSTLPSFELDVSSLSSGMYFLKASSEGNSLILRFIKQ